MVCQFGIFPGKFPLDIVMNQRRPQGDAKQPFDQRFLFFVLASMSVLLLYQSFTAVPPVDPAKAVDPAEQLAEAEPNADAQVSAPIELAEPVEASEELSESPAADPARFAIGSVESEGPYRMLLTVDNVGAGVERIELASKQYLDLDNRSGYLGQLGLVSESPEGARVTVVGAGTPAEAAGLKVGDVLVSALHQPIKEGKQIESVSIGSAEEFNELLATTKPKDSIKLSVVRDGVGKKSISCELRRQPLNLIRPELENIALHETEVPVDYEAMPSFLVNLTNVDGKNAESETIIEANRQLREEAWQSGETTSEQTITFSKQLTALGLEVVKRFEVVEVPEAERENLAYAGYHFNLSVEIKNLATTQRTVTYELEGPNGLPIEGYWYVNKIGRGWSGYGIRDVVVRFANDRFTQVGCSSIADGDVDPMGQGKPLAYAGVDAQYFASIIIPQKANLTDVKYSAVTADLATPKLDDKKAKPIWDNASCSLIRQKEMLSAAGTPGDTLGDDYQIFAGPKLPALLKAYQVNGDVNHSLDNLLYYGWFGAVSKLMLGILHFFNSIIGNYGIAIILLTVLVRGCMFPISRSQAKNMVKMQQLKPEMDKIAAKYKDDMQKRSAAQQELFKKHSYNPAAGCLPVFLQLPIFLGLYRALAVDVELRQAPLFSESIRFCSNLAAPDMFYDWSSFMPQWMNTGMGMLGLGPYFNLLPIATVVLFLLQQKMFMPEATNDQMKLQQQMMKYMMGFMGLLFFKVPSGLCIYFIASSLWAIVERKTLPHPTVANSPALTDTIKPKKSTVNKPVTKNGSGGKKSKNKKKRK